MNNTRLIVSSATMALAALASGAAFAQNGQAGKPGLAFEKCHGAAKVGRNGYEATMNSCTGAAMADSQGGAWIYSPAGTCARLTGGGAVSTI